MYSVSYNDPDFGKKLIGIYKQYGVAVVTDVFTDAYCDRKMDDIVFAFEHLGTGVDRKNLKDTWTDFNLPPQTRPGMFQTIMGHIQPVWDIRSHPNVHMIFTKLYSKLRGKKIKDFTVSFDGLTVIPNEVGPLDKGKKDWPHLDQTIREDPWLCIQGQAVLTNTTAAFRCTPGSCHIYGNLLDIEEIPEDDKSNWCKFKKTKRIKRHCEEEKLDWQIPIIAPKGSFIVWSSSTVHSAKYADERAKPVINDPWAGWRGVVYVCYRPREEMGNWALKKRAAHVQNNRLTSHWGEKLFAKTPGGRYLYTKKRHQIIEDLLKEPAYIYDLLGEVKTDPSLI